jgi:hypothetical protein
LKTRSNWNQHSLMHTLAALATMGAFLFLVAAPRVHADDRDKCRQKIEKAEARLDNAIAKHGEHSHEAAERWRELRSEREHCYTTHHEWWSAKDHSWHKDESWKHDDRFPDEH